MHKQAEVDRRIFMSQQVTDPILEYYCKIINSDYLHYGYWDVEDKLTIEEESGALCSEGFARRSRDPFLRQQLAGEEIAVS